jgi:hypothetical protein
MVNMVNETNSLPVMLKDGVSTASHYGEVSQIADDVSSDFWNLRAEQRSLRHTLTKDWVGFYSFLQTN